MGLFTKSEFFRSQGALAAIAAEQCSFLVTGLSFQADSQVILGGHVDCSCCDDSRHYCYWGRNSERADAGHKQLLLDKELASLRSTGGEDQRNSGPYTHHCGRGPVVQRKISFCPHFRGHWANPRRPHLSSYS